MRSRFALSNLKTLIKNGEIQDLCAKARDRKRVYQEWARGTDHLNISELANIPSSYFDTAAQVLSNCKRDLDGYLLAIVQRAWCLPKDFCEGAQSLAPLVARAPKTTLKELHCIADKLHLTLLPWALLSSSSYAKEGWQKQMEIYKFAWLLEGWFNVYVLAPISCYNVVAHIEAVGAGYDPPIYFGGQLSPLSPAFATIIPVLSELSLSISRVRSELTGTINDLGSRINQLGARTQRIENEMKRQREQDAYEQETKRRAIEVRRMNAWAKSEEEDSCSPQFPGSIDSAIRNCASMRECASKDPIIFAFNPDKTIDDEDAVVVIGPCWGPEFDLAALGLGHNKNTIDDAVSRVWYSPNCAAFMAGQSNKISERWHKFPAVRVTSDK